MSAKDCYELGHQSYKNKIFKHAATWLQEALNRAHENPDEIWDTFKYDALSYLTKAHSRMSNIYLEGNHFGNFLVTYRTWEKNLKHII